PITAGTPGTLRTAAWLYTLRLPVTTSPIARVMISGCTRNTATPTPLTRPTASPTSRPATIARVTPNGAWLAMMYAAAVATLATERSIPPVMTTSVWPAASMPNGAANSTMFDTQLALTAPG